MIGERGCSLRRILWVRKVGLEGLLCILGRKRYEEFWVPRLLEW
jgi:hypothetical protein